MNNLKLISKTLCILLLLFLQAGIIFSQTTQPIAYTDLNNEPRFAYPLRDLAIAADVAKAIYTNPILNRYDINFKVKNNQVYLYGNVDMDGAREYAEQITSSIVGVQGVQNNIRYQQGDIQETQTAYEADLEILEEIYSRYESSPIIDIEDIHISVYNGVVRLSGVVNSYLEKDLAVIEAQNTGARRVFNLLVVGEGPDTREIRNPGDFLFWPY